MVTLPLSNFLLFLNVEMLSELPSLCNPLPPMPFPFFTGKLLLILPACILSSSWSLSPLLQAEFALLLAVLAPHFHFSMVHVRKNVIQLVQNGSLRILRLCPATWHIGRAVPNH